MPKDGFFDFNGDKEIVLTCDFEAPRELVYRVSTDPEMVPRWWGPARLATTVDKMDVREGGEWRFVQRDADGNEFAFSGVYSEVSPPGHLVYTFNFEPMPGHELVETITFEEKDGVTTFRDVILFQSPEDRDGMAQSGMKEGAGETMDRMTALLKELRGKA
jgi:uncharacterized protein YndB with AHSA1/START domain